MANADLGRHHSIGSRKKGRIIKLRSWRRARQGVQALSLLGFTLLVVYTFRDVRGILAADGLLRLDPLAGIAAMLSTRRWLVRFVPAAVLVVATLGLGRFWCGWLCPLGTLIDWSSPRRRQAPGIEAKWRGLKYGLLFMILFSALWGNLTLLILDPLTIFVRTMGTVILPGLQWIITQVEIVLYNIPFLYDPLAAMDAALQGRLLLYEQPAYGGVVLIAAMFGGVLALNLVSPRAWCRYLCPLGGLLALVAKASPSARKVSSECVSCGRCASGCRMKAIEASEGYASDRGECIVCMDCAVECPPEAISFVRELRVERRWPHDPSRRQILRAMAGSVAAVGLLNIAPGGQQPDPHLLRPLGADERDLLASCIRCGACLRTCPTQGLQPSLTESGLIGLWTPVLVPRLGHCEYSCIACGEICPTGAIPRLPLEQKQTTPIGKAYIDPALCIAWSGRGPCIVCEEMCPLPEKAITLEMREGQDRDGNSPILQVPIVNHERCIGCGLCERKCPIHGQAAIRVVVDPMG